MTKQLLVISTLALTFSSCFTPKAVRDQSHVKFAKEHSGLVEEMAAYAIRFGLSNNVREFYTEQIADRKTRRKMYNLGAEIDINFGNRYEYDSTVVFKTINFSGVYEYIYDFATHPRMHGNKNQPGDASVRIQVTDRIYYVRRPFPMM